MARQFHYSTRNLLALVAVASLSLTVLVQFVQQRQAAQRYEMELSRLRKQLHETQQLLESLPVDDPQRPHVLATPSYAPGRWSWRAFLPPGQRYAVMVRNGPVGQEQGVWHVQANGAETQQIGVEGKGEMTIIVQHIPWGSHPLLGVSINEHEITCQLHPEVDRCMADRCPYQEQQSGSSGVEVSSAGERVDLLLRRYPSKYSPDLDSGPLANKPVGIEVWLEPM